MNPFIVPSSLDILSNRRPAKLLLYDPLRYGVLSSDDRYYFVLKYYHIYGKFSIRKHTCSREKGKRIAGADDRSVPAM